MTDYRAIARARELPLSAEQLDRAAAALESLETAFRPLTADLPPSLEPATSLCPEGAE